MEAGSAERRQGAMRLIGESRLKQEATRLQEFYILLLTLLIQSFQSWDNA
ncbi:MAG TPA: hypothetical protein VEI80_00140 [Candidatus Acidoferrales bacterium]|nr:hypothetical protein [Candidatus Acidoferrales bacterium]